MESAQTHELVANWYGAMGRMDWDAVMNALSDDVVFTLAPKPYTRMIPYLGVWEGKAAFAEASRIRNETSQISGLDLLGVVAEGNSAVALIRSKSTAIATNRYFELDIVQWIQVSDDGKIVKVDAYFDPVPEMDAFKPGVVQGYSP